MLDQLTVDSFRPAVGETFSLDDGEGNRLDLELIEARTHQEDAPVEDESGKRSPFLVHFRGPPEPVLPQRIYKVEHGSTGALEIFLVPIGMTPDGIRYEAIFA
jgi:hypothetical protein